MKNYPFLIRGPTTLGRTIHKSVKAATFKDALNKILALYPIKFVNSKFALQMDLVSVKKEAIKLSKSKKGVKFTIHLNEAEGEFYITFKNAKGFTMLVEEEGQEPNEIGSARLNKWVPQSVWMNGSEIAMEVEQQEVSDKAAKRNIPAQSDKAAKIISQKETKTTNKMAKANKGKAAAKTAPKAKATGTGKATTLILSDTQWKKVEGLTAKEGSIREMVAKAMIKTYGL